MNEAELLAVLQGLLAVPNLLARVDKLIGMMELQSHQATDAKTNAAFDETVTAQTSDDRKSAAAAVASVL